MVAKVELLEKIRMIKDAPMMARFALITIRRSYNCIVVNPELTTVLLMLQESTIFLSRGISLDFCTGATTQAATSEVKSFSTIQII